MNKIIVTTQKELDQILMDFDGEIIITGGNLDNPINLNYYYKDAVVILSDNAVVEMWGNSQVNYMRENSQVNYMRENSQVKEMWGNSQVNYMWGNSQVNYMWGNGLIKQIHSNTTKINCFGYNYLFVSNQITDLSNIVLNDTSQILRFDTFETKPTIDFYLKNYNVKKKDDNTLLMYKAVHRVNELEFTAHYNLDFKYCIGETKQHECSSNNTNSCEFGLHVSDLMFAVKFGASWDNLAIIEVEVPINNIIVSTDCDGKVRTSELTVIRELHIDEYKHLL